MSPARREPTAATVVRNEDIPQEIARSLGSIWQRRTGVRPSSISAEVSGDVVACAIDAGEQQVESGYQQEACAAVTKIARRKVSAYIAKTDAKTGIATQKFIFERIRVKY
jgi:hypothetical protein